MQCSSVNQAHSPGNCTFPHSTCNHASRSAAFFPVFMLLLFKFVISNSPKIGNLALTFPIACGKLINADEAACLISLDADIAQLVERLIRNHQVKGSSPFIGSIFYRGVAQFGSAFGSGPKGRRFKSCHLDCKPLANVEFTRGFAISVFLRIRGNQCETALMHNIMSNAMHNIVHNTSKTAHPLYISSSRFTSAVSSIIFSCSQSQIACIEAGTS